MTGVNNKYSKTDSKIKPMGPTDEHEQPVKEEQPELTVSENTTPAATEEPQDAVTKAVAVRTLQILTSKPPPPAERPILAVPEPIAMKLYERNFGPAGWWDLTHFDLYHYDD